MKNNLFKGLLAFSSLTLLAPVSESANLIKEEDFPVETSKSSLNTNQSSSYEVLKTEPVSKDASTGPQEEEDPVLPFFAKEARERGYELPNPFGININYMHIKQDIVVEDIKFSNLAMKIPLGKKYFINVPIPSNLFEIGVKSTKQRSHTETLRLDAWVFPFMNVYGVIGKTKGSSLSKVSVSSSEKNVQGIISAMGGMDDLDFKLKFKGKTYGGGVTFAGGVGNWFGLVDLNYTETKLDIISGHIKAFTLAPRIGYRFKTPGIESINYPEGHLSLWVGTMYQDVTQNFNGKLSDLSFSPKLQGIINAVNYKKEGQFHVNQHLKSPWNMLVGARYEAGKHFDIITEVGFNKRKSIFVAGEFRF